MGRNDTEHGNKKNYRGKKGKKAIKVILIIAAVFFVMNAIATKIIYDMVFKRYDAVMNEKIAAKYEDFIAGRDVLSIPEGKEEIRAYFYDLDNEKGLVIIAPGLHAGADDLIPVAEGLYKGGYDILVFDPVGSVDSTGRSAKGFSREIFDLGAVMDYARTNLPGEDIYLLGHSRGTFAVCARLAEDSDIKAAVSVSAHNSAMDAIISYSSRYVGPVANLNYPALWCYQALLFGPGTLGLKADRLVNESTVPVLIAEGSEDDNAPPDKYSLYSKRNGITRENVFYYWGEEPGRNGHTDILFKEDEANQDLIETVLVFFERAANAQ
ncbi:MAG: alpha/beta fold hydrolase [Lachnospiraceae bacterium]|nr:alpha/beta fold hydrolase [Lachnospiraceae bacterium]